MITRSDCLAASGTTRRAASTGSVNLKPGGAAFVVSVRPTNATRTGFDLVSRTGTSRTTNAGRLWRSGETLTVLAEIIRLMAGCDSARLANSAFFNNDAA